MPHGIVAEADDVVVDTTVAQLAVIVTGDVPVAGLLGMDDDLGLGTHLTTGLAACLQETAEGVEALNA